jgi:gliding motility-associated-like protein
LAAGNYTIGIKDKNGCLSSVSVTITEPGALTITTAINDVSCDGGNDGSVQITASAGTSPYQYRLGSSGSWQSSNTFGTLTKGSYTVYVRDANLCQTSSTVVINESVTITAVLDVNSSANLCLGNVHYFSGSRSTINSGTMTMDWDFGDGTTKTGTSVSHTYSTAGTFAVTLTVTGSTGCVKVQKTTVKTYPNPIVVYCPIDIKGNCLNQQCFRGNKFDFKSTSYIASGTISNYDWDFGDGSTKSGSGVTQTSHSYSKTGKFKSTLTLKSDNGCVSTDNYDVNVLAHPIAKGAISSADSCYNSNYYDLTSNGTSAVAGSIIKNYVWDFGTSSNPASSTVDMPKNIQYSVDGTKYISLAVSDLNGCSDTTKFNIKVYPSPLPKIELDATTPNAKQCFKGNAFKFVNKTTIKSGNLTYNWDFGDGTTSTATSPSSKSYSKEGSYSVVLKVTSDIGCIATTTFQIVVYPTPKPDFATNAICSTSYTIVFNDASSLASGKITNYYWDFGDGNTDKSKSPTHTYAASGNYSVSFTVESDMGCKETVTKSVAAYDRIAAKFTVNSTICGVNTSVAFTNASLAPTSSTYEWDFGDGTQSSQESPKHNFSKAGTFKVTLKVISPDGCVANASETIQIFEKPTAAFDVNALICNNSGAANFTNKSTINSGTISYYWEFGDGNTSTSTSPTNKYTTYGSYTVKLTTTSNYGCSDVISKSINVRPRPVSSFNITNVQQCLSTNSITLEDKSSISTGSYSFTWQISDGSTSTNSTPYKYSFKSAGMYSINLIVESSYGCLDTASKTIDIFPEPKADFTINKAGQCVKNNKFEFKDTSTVTSAGGISIFSWDFGDGTVDKTNSNKVFKTFNTYGKYYVKLEIISQKGCADKVVIPVNVYDMPIANFSVNAWKQCLQGNDYRFNNLSTITTGNGLLKYDWDFGNGDTTSQMSPSKSFTQSGKYNVTLGAISTYGCFHDTIIPIDIWQNPDAPVFTVDKNIPCHGMLGKLSALVTGGTIPYQYSWSGAAFQSNNYLDSIPAGKYTLKIKDKNGCTSESSTVLSEPDLLTIKVLKLNDALCNGFANAKAKIDSIAGGVSPYYSEWIQNAKVVKTGLLLNGVKAGLYYAKVRDLNGCVVMDSIEMYQPTKLTGAISIVTPIRCFGTLGKLKVDVFGGIQDPNRFKGYNYYWDGSKDPSPTNELGMAKAGWHSVMVYDSNGCQLPLTFQLNQPTKLIGKIDSSLDVRCYKQKNGTIYGSATGGLLNYKFYWTDTLNRQIAEGQKLDGVGSGYYKLVVVDRNDCVDSVNDVVQILQPDPIAISLIDQMRITCNGGQNGKLRVTANGGNGLYNYEWLIKPVSVKDSFIDNLPEGKYFVRATDKKGCFADTAFVLIDPLKNIIRVPNDSIEICEFDTLNLGAQILNAAQYNWRNINTDFGWQVDSSLTISGIVKNQGGVYKVRAIDRFGCQDSTEVSVIVNPLPTIKAFTKPVIACIGSSCELNAQGGVKYMWYKERFNPVYGRDTLPGNLSNYIISSVTKSDTGRYFVKGISLRGCANETDLRVRVGLDSILIPSDAQVCSGAKFILSAGGGVSYQWKLPNGTNLKLPSVIFDPMSEKDSGIYTLQVTDRWNCQGDYKVNILVNPKPKITLVDNLIGKHCEDNDLVLMTNTDASKIDWYGPRLKVLSTASRTQILPKITIKDQGDYKVVAHSIFGCQDSASLFVKVNPNPIVDFGFTHACPPNPIANDEVNFFSTSLKASKFQFYVDNDLVSTSNSFKYKFTTPGTYIVKLKATNEFQCSKEMSQTILVEEPVQLWVPNAFTPNNDRLNSIYKPVSINVPNYHMWIYDRWGGKMFEQKNGVWDGTFMGKPAPIGVYVVIVKYSTICSSDKELLDKMEKTSIQLLR